METGDKYNEALERARKWYASNTNEGYRGIFEDIFPELKESEDEKIRKVLVDYFKRYKEERGGSTMFYGIPTDDISAWLEKQGENNPLEEGTFVNVDEVREDFIQEVYRVLDADSTNDRANQIIDAFDNLPTTSIQKPAKNIAETQKTTSLEVCHQTSDSRCGLNRSDDNTKIFSPNDIDEIMEKGNEQKSVEWSEEDENGLGDALWAIKQAKTIAKDENDMGNLWYAERWLNSIKDRVWSNQGEQTSLQTNERAWLYLVSDVLTWKDGIGQYLDDPRVQELAKKLRSEYAQKLYNSVQDAPNEQKPIEVKGKSALEAVKEEKVDNDIKAEPNLKVDDWVVRKDGETFRNGSNAAQVSKIQGALCYLDTGRWLYNSEIRPWSVNDAVAGDILTDEKDNPFIYCGHDPDYWKYLTAYCGISLGEFIVHDKPTLWTSDTVEPATKEQCESLLQKMKESGYEWDSKRRVLVRKYK